MATLDVMNTLLQTDEFRAWLGELKDIRAKAVIFNRLDRATKGNFGDAKALGGGVSEMRIDSGPGYRNLLHPTGRDCLLVARWWRQINSGPRYPTR